MRPPFVPLMLLVLPGFLHANTVSTTPVQIRGHVIGEPVSRFLRLEADAREEMEVCRQHPNRSVCQELEAAVNRGGRTEISATAPIDLFDPDKQRDVINFVLDGGKVVKMTMLLTDPADAKKWFGEPSALKTLPSQNRSGQKWENLLSVWDLPDAYVTLFEDHNPALEDKRPTLIVETQAERAREGASTKAPTSPH